MQWDRWDADRPQYAYAVEIIGTDILVTGADLRLGAFDRDGQDSEALGTLLTFLGAYVEAVHYSSHHQTSSDNEGIFPDSLRTWAECVDADELAMLASTLHGES